MEMLRHHSHGFNLEATSDATDYLTLKEKVKNGDFLEHQKLVGDWEPHAIEPKEPLRHVDKVTDYWFQSGSFTNNNLQNKVP